MSAENPKDFKDFFEKVKKGYDKAIKGEGEKDKRPAGKVDFGLNPEQQEVIDEIKKEKIGLPEIGNNSHHITPSSPKEVLKEKYGEDFPEIRSANNKDTETKEPNSGEGFKDYDWDKGWRKAEKKENR